MITDIIARYPALEACGGAITEAVGLIGDVYKTSGILYICGNGGSAADAEHISSELLKGFLLRRELALADAGLLNRFGEPGTILAGRLQTSLPAVPISSFISLSTAVANDIASDMVFAQAVWGLTKKNDALM
ncbi:MAG: SIS domain-containing protein, partial [Oscillospiraceae bacterium]|nr:SIS domain-containing protein [Oscillospiraceae bacterium]